MKDKKVKKYPNLEEVVQIFSEPNLLHKTIKEWSNAEPKNMKEILSNIPNPSVKEIIKGIT